MAEMYWVNNVEAKDGGGIEAGAFQLIGNGEVPGGQFPTVADEARELRRIIDGWEGNAVVVAYHPATASWVFMALHDELRRSYVGGCRIKHYQTPADGLRDAMLLAGGMTHKWAIIGSDLSGGKAVLAITLTLDQAGRTALLLYFASILEALDGLFYTGVDFGTTVSDLATLAGASKFVHGFDLASGRLLDSGLYTAMGVAASIRTALWRVFGNDELVGRTVLVQGVGQVGGHLARMLAAGGARVLISDSRQEQAERLAEETGGEIVSCEEVYTTPCDVYAPCALGGTLSEETAALLKCRIVAGAANNQLQDITVADRLHERAILYAPDYVINAGGAIALPMFRQGAQEREVCERVEGIALTLAQILAEAESLNESPLYTAERRVAQLRSLPRLDDGQLKRRLGSRLV